MKPQLPDVISAGPRAISSRAAWATAVVLLTAALAVAITAAVHYRGEVAALHRQVRPVPVSLPPSTVPVTLSSTTVALAPYGALNGQVTVFSAWSSGELARIVLSAYISGGRPHTRYTLTGFDCAGSPGYQTWAAGVTDAGGSGNLTGQALTVSLKDDYWLYLSPPPQTSGPSLRGSFTAAGKFSASSAGSC
ncbi:MAG: hypothetical protein ACRDPY_21800 [Streptosporangiaceae bacterium]